MSLGAIHGRMWRGKKFQCCGQSGGREKKWLLNNTFFQRDDFSNLSKTSPHSKPHWFTSSKLLSLSSVPPLQFYLYFLEAWHHLHVLSLVSHQLIYTRTMPLRAGNENEDPRKCQAGILPFGATSQLGFLLQLTQQCTFWISYKLPFPHTSKSEEKERKKTLHTVQQWSRQNLTSLQPIIHHLWRIRTYCGDVQYSLAFWCLDVVLQSLETALAL